MLALSVKLNVIFLLAVVFISFTIADRSKMIQETASVELRPVKADGTPIPCRIAAVRHQGQLLPGVSQGLVMTVPILETYSVDLRCQYSDRSVLVVKEISSVPGPRKIFKQFLLGDCSRDMMMEFRSTYTAVQGRLEGQLPAGRPLVLVMMHEASRVVTEAKVENDGTFAIDLRCEGNYLASLMVAQENVGLFSVLIRDREDKIVIQMASLVPFVPPRKTQDK